jgi:hypothetical protein
MKKSLLFGSLTFLLVCIVVIAGCTTSTTNQTTTSTPSTAASRDAFLEKYISQLYNNAQKNYTVTAWDVNWRNSSTVNVILTTENETSQTVVSENRTIMHFESTDDAIAYFNGLNITGYILYENIYTGGAYQDVTGHTPVPYKAYVKELNANETSFREILGDIIITKEITSL